MKALFYKGETDKATVNRTRILPQFSDVVFVVLLACTILCVCAPYAYAYVDPSVVTYTIQAIAGVAVVLGAVAGVFFRRSRNAIMKVFHINPNAQKIQEENVYRIDADNANAHLEANKRTCELFGKRNQCGTSSQQGSITSAALTWKTRFVFACMVSIFLCFTLFVCAPAELVAGNNSDLVFSLTQVLPALLLTALVASIVLALGLSAIRGRAFEITLACEFAIAFCIYLQPLLLNSGLSSADGRSIEWQQYLGTMIVNLIIWIAIVAAIVAIVIFAHNKHALQARMVIGSISVVLFFVQCVGVGSLCINATDSSKTAGTNAGLFELSSKNNTIMFVLDSFDSEIALTLQSDYPELYAQVTSEMDGFTFFPNSTASFIPTEYAIPYLLTGQKPQSGESWSEYLQNRYSRSSYLQNICDAGFSLGIYTDSLNADEETTTFLAQNSLSHKTSSHEIDTAKTIAQLYVCALYRNMPWVLKPLFWFTTDQLNTSAVQDSQTQNYNNNSYVMDDAGFYELLTSNHLAIQASDSDYTGAYRLIHMLGSHGPYLMDENCQQTKSDVYHQTLGSLRIVNEYLRQMKEMGIYDEATIIITADHGNWYFTDTSMTKTSCPATYVKTSNSAVQQGISQSTAQLTHGDLLATVAQTVGFDENPYGTCVANLEADVSKTREFYWTLSDGTQQTGIQKYLIEGWALNIQNWHETNEIYLP